MNERIRELAIEAEFSEKDLHIQGDNFQKFAALVAEAEREACAKLCDKIDDGREDLSAECAAAIRARGEK